MTQITIKRINTQKKIFRSVAFSLFIAFLFYVSIIGLSIFEVIDYKKTLAASEDKSFQLAKLESEYNIAQKNISLASLNTTNSNTNLKKIDDNIFIVRKNLKTNFSMLYEAR